MNEFAQAWGVSICKSRDDGWELLLTHFDDTTGVEVVSFGFYRSSSVLFQECMSVLDASIFTSLAIAEGVLPEGQLPL